ncbi:flagellar hook-associated protein FlgK [Modestobacter roseus]|uniref:Flagellar hook-associated protein 1 n=1 Tax=Modestobacter roseus TaxID=1181884 RepID=A0A562IL50_9ACTN|nr:flagellar hook-associated protein FlgK [Modestobacter roseus]MQA34561.1 flagellar hook-associated protein FlgK [Modestobacter roseus]TWH71618.1 flagellar hook-associated protein 1 FlgK [Modestobacter roseus]
MSGTFGGLNTATSALWAQQRGLDVTGQNVANVNTEGYSRQRAELQSVGGNPVPAIWSVSKDVGQGVNADTVIRIRDAFLEARAQAESGRTASLTVHDTTLAQIEQAFREPGETGIQAKLTDVFKSWGDLASNPTEDGARTAVLQKTATLVAEFRTTDAALDKAWTQTRSALDVLADDVNTTIAQVAQLNTAIKKATQTGLPSNELADQRDALVLKLSQTIGATSSKGDFGTVDVAVGGATLISGSSSTGLRVVGTSDPLAVTGTDPRLVTDPGGTTVTPGGTGGGQLTALRETIPGYRARLDGVAQRLADEFNSAHTAGVDKTGAPGGALFDDGAGALTGITAKTLTLAISDTRRLAAADGSTAPTPTTDNRNAMAIAKLQSSPDGTAVAYRQLIVQLGVDASVATGNLKTQTVVASQVEASREAVSGVNLDEEMTNMLRFQHGYSAAARMITTIDETLDVLINRTGRVGL